MVVVATCDCETELEPNDVVLVKAIALQGVYDENRLLNCVEVCEAKVHFVPVFGISWHKSQLVESGERPKQVRNFSLCGVVG